MTGPAVQAGSALGGFIEGVTGGFERRTEFKRRRRLEQQVADRLGRQDVRQVALDEEAAETLRRARELEDLNLFLEHGIVRTPSDAGAVQEVPESVSRLREATGAALAGSERTQPPGADPRAVGANLIGQDETQAVDPTDAMLARLGFRQAVDRPQRPFTVDVGGVETVVGSEEEALRLQGAFAPPAASTIRSGVTGTGEPGFFRIGPEGGAERVPGIAPPTTGTRDRPAVQAAYQILKDRYAQWEDDGSGKLVFQGYSKTEAEIYAEAQAMARGGPMAPRAPEALEVEEEKGPGLIARAGQAIRGIGRPEVSLGESPLDRFLQVPGAEEERGPRFMEAQMRALELEEEGKTREEIRRIMRSEGYKVE